VEVQKRLLDQVLGERCIPELAHEEAK